MNFIKRSEKMSYKKKVLKLMSFLVMSRLKSLKFLLFLLLKKFFLIIFMKILLDTVEVNYFKGRWRTSTENLPSSKFVKNYINEEDLNETNLMVKFKILNLFQ